jgi:hypothetical protein
LWVARLVFFEKHEKLQPPEQGVLSIIEGKKTTTGLSGCLAKRLERDLSGGAAHDCRG